MSKVNTLLNLSAFILGMTLLPQAAFSQTKQGTTGATELVKSEVIIGTGEEATVGKMAEVHYTGWLFDPAGPLNKGKKFDSSRDRNSPFSFLLGAGRVIKGWDKGVVGMKVGETRELMIPASLGYGDNDFGPIPGGSTLVFEVELLEIK